MGSNDSPKIEQKTRSYWPIFGQMKGTKDQCPKEARTDQPKDKGYECMCEECQSGISGRDLTQPHRCPRCELVWNGTGVEGHTHLSRMMCGRCPQQATAEALKETAAKANKKISKTTTSTTIHVYERHAMHSKISGLPRHPYPIIMECPCGIYWRSCFEDIHCCGSCSGSNGWAHGKNCMERRVAPPGPVIAVPPPPRPRPGQTLLNPVSERTAQDIQRYLDLI